MKPLPRPSIERIVAAALACACALAAAPARAQTAHVDDNDWRQSDRHDALLNAAPSQKFAVELRFGPYLPDIDSEFAGKSGATPFNTVFGEDCSGGANTAPVPGLVAAHFYFGAEFDYLPLRIPYVGAVGLGVGWGYTSFSNSAIFTAGPNSGKCSEESTTLTIMPMHASVVLRADELMRRTGVPLVPYGKFGFGLAWWRASTSAGTEVCPNASTSASAEFCKTPTDGTGLTPSLHFALGLMLSLNFIDASASARLGESTGVKHAYLFGEVLSDKLTLAGDVMHVGATTWVVGLAADM
jgi:hypothetical protein